MFAGAAEVDPADYHKLVRLVLEFGLKMPASVVGQPGKYVAIRSRDTAGRFPQAVPIRVLADGTQNLTDRPFDPGQVDGGFGFDLQSRRSVDQILVAVA